MYVLIVHKNFVQSTILYIIIINYYMIDWRVQNLSISIDYTVYTYSILYILW